MARHVAPAASATRRNKEKEKEKDKMEDGGWSRVVKASQDKRWASANTRTTDITREKALELTRPRNGLPSKHDELGRIRLKRDSGRLL